MAPLNPVLLQTQQEPEVFLGQVVQMVVNTSMVDLRELVLALPSLTDLKRKERILGFLHRTRHKLLKTLVLVQWATTNIKVLADQHRVSQFLQVRGAAIQSVLGILERGTNVLRLARAPFYDVTVATDILFSGTYLRLPRSIEQLADGEVTHDIEQTDEQATFQKLDRLILNKLLKISIPEQFSLLKVENGKLHCSVANEFDVILRLTTSNTQSVWRVLSIKLRVAGDPCAEWNGEHHALQDSQFPEAKLEMITQPESLSSEQRAKLANQSKSAIVKQYQLNYLLHLLQLRLQNSKDELGDLYNVVHRFAMSVCRQVLLDQFQTLSHGTWRRTLKLHSNLNHQSNSMQQNSVSFSLWPIESEDPSSFVVVHVTQSEKGEGLCSHMNLNMVPSPHLALERYTNQETCDSQMCELLEVLRLTSKGGSSHQSVQSLGSRGCKLQIGSEASVEEVSDQSEFQTTLARCGILSSCLSAERLVLQVAKVQGIQLLLMLEDLLQTKLSFETEASLQPSCVTSHISFGNSNNFGSDDSSQHSKHESESYVAIRLPWFSQLRVKVNHRNGAFVSSIHTDEEQLVSSNISMSNYSSGLRNVIQSANNKLMSCLRQSEITRKTREADTFVASGTIVVERACDTIAEVWIAIQSPLALDIIEHSAKRAGLVTRSTVPFASLGCVSTLSNTSAPTTKRSVVSGDHEQTTKGTTRASIDTVKEQKQNQNGIGESNPAVVGLIGSEQGSDGLRLGVWRDVGKCLSGTDSLYVGTSCIADAHFYLQFHCPKQSLTEYKRVKTEFLVAPELEFGLQSEISLAKLLNVMDCYLVCDGSIPQGRLERIFGANRVINIPEQVFGSQQCLRIPLTSAKDVITQATKLSHDQADGGTKRKTSCLSQINLFEIGISLIIDNALKASLKVVARVQLELSCVRLASEGFVPQGDVEEIVETTNASSIERQQVMCRKLVIRRSDTPSLFRTLANVLGLMQPSSLKLSTYMPAELSVSVKVIHGGSLSQQVVLQVDPVDVSFKQHSIHFEPVHFGSAFTQYDPITKLNSREPIATNSSQANGVRFEYHDYRLPGIEEESLLQDTNLFSKAVRYSEWTDLSSSSHHRALPKRPTLGGRVSEPPTTPMPPPGTPIPTDTSRSLKLQAATNANWLNNRARELNQSSNIMVKMDQYQARPRTKSTSSKLPLPTTDSSRSSMPDSSSQTHTGRSLKGTDIKQRDWNTSCNSLLQFPLFGLEKVVSHHCFEEQRRKLGVKIESAETLFSRMTLGAVVPDIDRAARMSMLCGFVTQVMNNPEFIKRCGCKVELINCTFRELIVRFRPQSEEPNQNNSRIQELQVCVSTPVSSGPIESKSHGFNTEFTPSIAPFGVVFAQFLEARVFVGASFEEIQHAVGCFLLSISNLFPCLEQIESVVGVHPDVLAGSDSFSRDDTVMKPVAKTTLNGKMGLSAQIEAQKAASEKGAASVQTIPLTISNTRFLLGELSWVDVQFRPNQVAILGGGGSKWNEALKVLESKIGVAGPVPLLSHDKLQTALGMIFGLLLSP